MAKTLPRDPGEALKALREQQGFTQEELEFKARVSQTVLSQTESGRRPMSYRTAWRVEKALDLPAGTLSRLVDEVNGLPL